MRFADCLWAVEQMRADIAALKEVVLQPRLGLLDSLIVPDFPRLFEEFRAKRWALLWRNSRDCLTTVEFHYLLQSWRH
jgi:hypothetical protein